MFCSLDFSKLKLNIIVFKTTQPIQHLNFLKAVYKNFTYDVKMYRCQITLYNRNQGIPVSDSITFILTLFSTNRQQQHNIIPEIEVTVNLWINNAPHLALQQTYLWFFTSSSVIEIAHF